MANRYWVGGAGTWDGTSTTHWSATSGGASGASVPTSVDDVFVDGNSGGGTINVSGGSAANCRAFDTTGFTGTLANGNLNANGSVTLSATTIATTFLLQMVAVNGITTTLTTNGVAFTSLGVFGTGTGTVILADALTLSSAMTLTSGTFNTNNKICTWAAFATVNSNVRTITFGTSAITITGSSSAVWGAAATNLTISANTAVVTMTGTSANFRGVGMNWNGLSLVYAGTTNIGTGGDSFGTFKNVTFTGSAIRGASFFIGGSLTVTGTLTITGNSTLNRVLFYNQNSVGTPITVTAAAVSLSNVDFMDIAGAGAAAPFTGTSMGNCLGNSSITFDTPTAQTHTASAGGNWSDVTKWTSRVPLPQDTVVIDANTTGTLTADMPRLGADIDCTGFTGTLSVTSLAVTSYGSLTLASGMSTAQNQFWNFNGRGTHAITSNGRTFGSAVLFNIPGGTYSLADALTSNGTIQIAGTFNTNGFTMTSGYNINLSASSVVDFGTSTVNSLLIAASNVLNASNGSAISASKATFVVVNASANPRYFKGNNQNYGALTYTVPGSTGGLTIYDSNTFGTINFSDATNARALQFASGTVNTIGVQNIVGTVGKPMTLSATTPGSPAVLVSPRPWRMGANSTDVSGNSGLSFVAGPDMDYLSVQDITGSQTGQGSFFRIM